MARDPAERYQTAREILRDLARVQKGLSVGLPVPPPSTTHLPLATVSQSAVAGPAGVPEPARTSWARWVGRAVMIAVLGIGGWWAYGQWNPLRDTRGLHTGPGLPDARPPEPVTTARERALKARIASRESKPAEVFTANLELALIYVKERRLDEAETVFKVLESERPERLPPAKEAAVPAVMAGRLGQAIVLAYRDRAKESNEHFERALYGPPRVPALAIDRFLLAHPDLAQAVGAALDRNAENLNVPRLPDRLEWLRTPGGIARGPKG
jgi:serine/threonine-protein kinase